MRDRLDLALSAAQAAGQAILAHYGTPVAAVAKGDGSPLTAADTASHAIIAGALADSGIPVVSEEGSQLLLDATRYWLVDPLDGTKDFLAGNGEFTVNIALIDDQRPVLGVVLAPALDEAYLGGHGLGAWRWRGGGVTDLRPSARSAACRMAVSRFHDHPDVEVFATDNRITQRVTVGSALKYGHLAASEADVFPRLVGSSEWDTAAGQAVLEAVGGQVLDWHTGTPLRYGKANRRNPRLLAIRPPYRFDEFHLHAYEPELL
jgi:3'(2'), 5'-bisphosphate nucleotidase